MRLSILAMLTLSLSITGCQRMQEAMLPVVDKINAAHPLSPEVQVAQARLFARVESDPGAKADLQTRTDARVNLRALVCTKNVSIGRLDSIAAVKALPLDRSCFQDQDRELGRFFGLRAVGLLLAQPPLRPLKPAGAIATLPRGRLQHVLFGSVARDASVAVLRDGAGDAAVVELPGGKPIANLPRMSMASEWKSHLSANGRVLAVDPVMDGSVVFLETETGERIWESGEGGFLLEWLPHVSGFLMSTRDGTMLLADTVSGSVVPHPLAPKGSTYAARILGEQERTLVGTSHTLVLLEHTRTPYGIVASTHRTYTIDPSAHITSGQPMPMRSGRMVVYANGRDIAWLDLQSGASGKWRNAPYFGIPSAKLDESHLMFDSVERDRHIHQNLEF